MLDLAGRDHAEKGGRMPGEEPIARNRLDVRTIDHEDLLGAATVAYHDSWNQP